MHETHAWVGIGVREEEDICIQGTDAAVGEDAGILDDMVARLLFTGGLESMSAVWSIPFGLAIGDARPCDI